MGRHPIGWVALAACLGCSQTELPSPATVATPLAAAPAAPPVKEPIAAAKDAVVASQPAVAESASVQAAPTAKPRTAAKPVVVAYSSAVPAVLMSAMECANCAVGVGDPMPAIRLPQLKGGDVELASLAGKQATVVVFWGADRWMSHAALVDLQKDVAEASADNGVAVVGVAVGQKPDAAAAEVEKSAAKFPQLLDADGKALAQLGAPALPRIYVLDAAGKVAWFDIEYSEATRRDLHDALAGLTASKSNK